MRSRGEGKENSESDSEGRHRGGARVCCGVPASSSASVAAMATRHCVHIRAFLFAASGVHTPLARRHYNNTHDTGAVLHHECGLYKKNAPVA